MYHSGRRDLAVFAKYRKQRADPDYCGPFPADSDSRAAIALTGVLWS